MRIPPLADAQGNDVTGRWPLRSYLELGALPSAVSCARLHTRQLLWEWHLTTLADDAELMVSELTTNAVQITQADGRGAPVRLWLLADQTRLLILVWDASPLPPVRMNTSGDAENGRGLLLVETLSTRWGFFACRYGGKVTWAYVEAALHAHRTVPVHTSSPASQGGLITDGRAMRIHRRYRTGLSDHRPRAG